MIWRPRGDWWESISEKGADASPRSWRNLGNGEAAAGEKGPIVARFARVRVYLSRQRTPESERTLLLRNDPDGRIKYALSNAPESVALSELIRVSAARWPIERCFQEDKSELGLDHWSGKERSYPRAASDRLCPPMPTSWRLWILDAISRTKPSDRTASDSVHRGSRLIRFSAIRFSIPGAALVR